jgi:hypothetical protein
MKLPDPIKGAFTFISYLFFTAVICTTNEFKQRFQERLNRLWEEKDIAIEAILAKQSTHLRTGKRILQ